MTYLSGFFVGLTILAWVAGPFVALVLVDHIVARRRRRRRRRAPVLIGGIELRNIRTLKARRWWSR